MSTNPDQGMQINENTIADPEAPEAEPGHDHLGERDDAPMKDHGLQINENTIADEDDDV